MLSCFVQVYGGHYWVRGIILCCLPSLVATWVCVFLHMYTVVKKCCVLHYDGICLHITLILICSVPLIPFNKFQPCFPKYQKANLQQIWGAGMNISIFSLHCQLKNVISDLL